MKNHFIFKRK